MASPAAVLQVFVNANTKVASAQLQAFNAQLTGVGKTSAATSVGMGKFTKGAAAAGAGVAAFGAAAVVAGKQLYDLGKQFDDAYDSIRVGTGATGQELEKLKGNFREVARSVPNDFKDVGGAIADLNTRLGLTGKPLEAMAENLLNLSNITETDLRGNIKSVARAFVDWEISIPQQVKNLDGLFRLSQASGASVDQLADSVQQFGSPLRQLGFSFGEASSAFALFERAGVNTQTMVPGLKLAISNLTRPTDKLAEQMNKLGIEAGAPDVALRQIFDLLGKSSTLSKIDKTGLAMDVFGKRAGADMAEAIKQGRFELDAFLKIFRDDQGDTIAKAASEAYDFSENIKILGNNFKVLLEPAANKVFVAMDKVARSLADAFREAESAEDVFRIFVEQAMKAMGKLVEGAVKIAPDVAGAFVQGFANANIWGKLAAGALLMKVFGGKALIAKTGALIGVQTGTSMAAGIAAAMGGGAAAGGAAAGGLAGRIGGVLKNIKWGRVGMIGVGIALGDQLMQSISKRVQQGSSDLGEALDAMANKPFLEDKINKIWDGIDLLFSGDMDMSEADAEYLKRFFDQYQAGLGRVLPAQQRELENRAYALNLNREQTAEVQKMFRLLEAGNKLGIAVGPTMDPEQLNRIISGFDLLRSGSLANLSDIDRALNRTGNTIKQNFGPKTAEGRKLLADNMRAAVSAIRKGMKDGSINAAEGTARIKQILGDAKLIDPTRKQARELGQTWARGFQRMGRITNSGVSEVLAQARKMPPQMRKIALNTMLSQLDAAKKAKDITPKQYRQMRSRILSEFSGLRLGVKKAAADLPKNTQSPTDRTKKQFDSVADTAEKSSKRIKTAIGSIPGPVRGAYGRLANYANTAAQAFDSDQRVNLSFRRGGMAKFSGPGLVPAMVSPGELVSYKGREVYVPGRPEPRDSVMMNLPAGAKIFTFDGQARLAMGASQSEALRKQAPHFAMGGIVGNAPKPKLVGGPAVPRATGQSAIDRGREQAMEWVRKLKPTLNMITRIASGFGLQMTSGYRAGDDGYHGVDRARDYSNSSGPTREMFKFGTYVANNFQKHLLELIYTPLGFGIKNGARTAPYAQADHYDHVHVAMRRGGIVPRFATGGQVVRQAAPILTRKGFDHKATAGILGNAWGESSWNPGAVGMGGGGLFGFTTSPVSLADLQAYAARKGKPWTDVPTQIRFMLYHGQPTGMAMKGPLNALSTIPQTTEKFMTDWERPGIPRLAERIAGGYEASRIMRTMRLGRDGESDSKKLTKKQKRILKKISSKFGNYPNRNQIRKLEPRLARMVEDIEIFERNAGADWSPGGSELDSGELSALIAKLTKLRDAYIKRRNLILEAMGWLNALITRYEAKIKATNTGKPLKVQGQTIKPGNKWQIPGFRRGIKNARGALGNLREAKVELQGLTGRGGLIGDTKFRLRELGATAPAGQEELNSLLRERLTQTQRALAISEAQMPVFQQFMPRFHQGGIVQGPMGAERPVMAQAGEGIFTRDQMRAMGAGNITVVIEDAAIDSNRIRVEVDGVLQEKVSTVRRQGSNRRFATK